MWVEMRAHSFYSARVFLVFFEVFFSLLVHFFFAILLLQLRNIMRFVLTFVAATLLYFIRKKKLNCREVGVFLHFYPLVLLALFQMKFHCDLFSFFRMLYFTLFLFFSLSLSLFSSSYLFISSSLFFSLLSLTFNCASHSLIENRARMYYCLTDFQCFVFFSD